MARLEADDRHSEFVVLGRWPTPARLFSSWAMARPNLTPLADQPFRLINETGSGAQVTGLLLNLVEDDKALYPLI